LRAGGQDSSHTDTHRATNGAQSYSKTSPHSSSTKNRTTSTSRRAFRIQCSDSSDSSEATPRAKHPKNRLRKFPTLDPLSISDPTVPEPDGGRGEAPLKRATSRVPSQTHRGTHPDTTTPQKIRKSRYPFPSPLSSPPYQQSQNCTTALRGTNPRDTLRAMADEDADDECQKPRPRPRPFPMAPSQSRATHRTPRRKTSGTEQPCLDDGRHTAFLNDSDVFGDDYRRRYSSMFVI
jgi:hypothetical protein